jgi:putative flippase GtrA
MLAAGKTVFAGMIDRIFLRFVLTGIANTILGLGVIYVARQWVGDFAANLIGFLLVVPVSFITHRSWSFRDAGSLLPTFSRYLPSVLAGYAANLMVLRTGLAIGANPYLVQGLAIATHVAISYLLSRLVVFLEPKK